MRLGKFTPAQPHKHTVNNFSRGINTDSAKPVEGELLECINMNLTKRGAVKLRGGSAVRNTSNPLTVTNGKGIVSLYELIRNTISGGDLTITRHRLAIAQDKLIKLVSTGNSITVDSLTTIRSGLSNDKKPSVETYQNRAFYANGVDLFWTDGTNAYDVGLEKPTAAPTNQGTAGTGGFMSDGTYSFKYAYARSSENGFYGMVNDTALSVDLSGGTSTQKVTVRCTASNNVNTSSDKIYLFRTKLGGSIYYKVGEANNPNNGSAVDIEATIGDNGILDTNIYSDNNEVPPASKYVVSMGNRMFYVDYHNVRYSKLNLPEAVPADNKVAFDENDGDVITGVGKILDYLLIFKNRKTYIMNPNAPSAQKPILISNNIGCDSYWSIQSVEDGQLTVWMSQEGFAATDGTKVIVICKDRIYNDLSENRDLTKNERITSAYYPRERQYVCKVPYKGNASKIWVFSTTDEPSFIRHIYPYKIDCFSRFVDDNEESRVVAAKHSVTSGYVQEMFVDDKNDDTAPIAWETKLTYTTLGHPEMTKRFHSIFVEAVSDAKAKIQTYVGVDGTDNISSQEIEFSGSTEYDNPAYGYDDPEHGYDMSGEENIAARHFGKGTSYSVRLTGISSDDITIKGLTMMFKPSGVRTERVRTA